MTARRPYEVAASAPTAQLTVALVRNLAEAVEGSVAFAVSSEPSWAVIESWPPGVTEVGDALERAEVTPAAGGAVFVLGARRWDDDLRELLSDTAAWLGLAVRLEQVRADRDVAESRARRLRTELGVARERLSKVRELERHRLVSAITTTTLRDLAEVRTWLAGTVEHGTGLHEAQDVLEQLIDDFRAVARGVFPAMLPDRGPSAALEELAATLPRPVRFTGELGRRAGWQLESGFYHAVAAVLNVLAGMADAAPVTVWFGRDSALRARVSARAALSEDELTAALAQDSERLAVLGGALRPQVFDGDAVVTVRVPERVEPVASPGGVLGVGVPLYRWVRELARQGRQAMGDGPAVAGWDVVAERLAMPPRLAVVGRAPDGGPAAATVDGDAVSVVDIDAPADSALAGELLAANPREAVDAVLCRETPTAEFRLAMRGGGNRTLLVEGHHALESVVDFLAARGPVFAARRAVLSMGELARGLPGGHPLRWEIERASVGSHEFAELDLLHDVERGTVLRSSVADAARLLGVDGVDARSRLGLGDDATDADVEAAARNAVERWRAHRGSPLASRHDRAACDVLVRTAEGLVSPVSRERGR